MNNPHADWIKKVRALLDAGKPKEALDLVNGRGSGDSALRNARGVCLMRMNEPALAVRALREINLISAGVVMRNDVAALYKPDFETALLLSGTASGCVGVLDEIGDDANPRVQQLRAAVERWKKELSLGRKLAWRPGLDPKHPVTLDFPPGELQWPWPSDWGDRSADRRCRLRAGRRRLGAGIHPLPRWFDWRLRRAGGLVVSRMVWP